MNDQNYSLKTSTKFKTIRSILNREKVSAIVDTLNIHEVIGFHDYLWELAVEFGIKVRGKKFNRKEITRQMPDPAEYQKKMGCPEQIYYCKGTHCIHSHPECATKKIKEHVDVMAHVIRGFIESEKEKLF